MLPLCCLLVATCLGQAASPSGAKLSGALRAALAARTVEEFLPVDLVLAEQAPPSDLRAARGLSPGERRSTVVTTLRGVAARTQPPLLAFLEEARRAGAVRGEVRTLWLHNVVSAEVSRTLLPALLARPDVALVHLDLPLGEETLLGRASSDLPTGTPTCGVERVRAPEVWQRFGLTGRGVVVGVIDTGVCIDHPDIRAQLWKNPGEVPGNGADDDRNGHIDDVLGWNFEEDSADIDDEHGHGSHVAGIVAGDGTSGTVSGVAPDAQVMALRFLSSFAGESTVWKAMEYGVANGAQVLSGSLGWPHRNRPLRAVWRAACDNAVAAGVVVVFAGGNEACDTATNNITTPADVPAVIAVGATACNDQPAWFTSCGPSTWDRVAPYFDHPYPPGLTKPDLCAPGELVVSHRLCDGYRDLFGTSMATPHVSGLVALLLQADPTLAPEDVRALLEETCVDLGEPGKDNVFGAGRIDALAAVEALLARDRGRRR